MESKANDTVTGKLFQTFSDEAKFGIDFERFVRDRRASGQWTEFELALSVKSRIDLADARFEDVMRDMREVK